MVEKQYKKQVPRKNNLSNMIGCCNNVEDEVEIGYGLNPSNNLNLKNNTEVKNWIRS